MLDSVVNWSLLAEPLNWLIVFLMLAIAFAGLALIAPGATS